MAYALQPISVTAATVTLDPDIHAETVVILNRAAGVTVTLPASTGKGVRFRILTGTTVSSNNNIIQVANASDVMAGVVSVASDIAGVTCPTTSTSDTITMSGTTTGGIKGSYVELIDAAANVWLVTGALVSSGTEATPFSAAVS